MLIDRDDVLRRTDLAALLDELTGQSVSGHRSPRWRCVERDHPDEHPSVTVTTDRTGVQRWRCWSGGHGGTAIDALVAAHGMTVREALEALADRAGTRVGPPLPPPRPRPRRDRPVADAVHRHVEACARILWTPAGRPVLDWLTGERGIPEAVLTENLVGCDPGLRRLTRPKGIPGGGVGAVVPALSPAGEVTYFQTRYLHPRPGQPKYENPASAMAANPRVAWVRSPTAPAAEVLVVCEGLPDAYTAAAVGLPAVAVLGAATPDGRVADALARHAGDRRLVLVFDADIPGESAAGHLRELLIERDAPVDVVTPPPALGDLNAWARADPAWCRSLAPGLTLPDLPNPAPALPSWT